MPPETITKDEIRKVQKQLWQLGGYPKELNLTTVANGDINAATTEAVKQFQRQVGGIGNIEADGTISSATRLKLNEMIAALREAGLLVDEAIADGKLSIFHEYVLLVAGLQVDVREEGRNDGKSVREYMKASSLKPGDPWCLAFVQWCFQRTAELFEVNDPMKPDTGHCLDFWNKTKAKGWTIIDLSQAIPGDIFIRNTVGARGHCGIVLSNLKDKRKFRTIEGNTNATGSEDGEGVYEGTRSYDYVNMGIVRIPVPEIPKQTPAATSASKLAKDLAEFAAGTLLGSHPAVAGGLKIFKFLSTLKLDADGSPRAYHPDDKPGLDSLDNGRDGNNWWGIVTKNGEPVIQGPDDPEPGFYVSKTSLFDPKYDESNPKRYVNSEEIPYFVLPRHIKDRIGAKVGDLGYVFNTINKKHSPAIFADVGPKVLKFGEGSLALARALELPAETARRGGTDKDQILYTVFPGSGNGLPRTKEEIRSIGEHLFAQLGGISGLQGLLT